jgi:glycosyltransferase involved in cell wall biosynthesis
MNKIKIAHVTFDMRIGGTEMVIKNIIEGSNTKLFEMSIFCIEKPLGPWGVELENAGTQVEAKERKPGFDLSLIFAIRKHIKENQIDVLHCHQYTPWTYGAIAAAGTKTKVIFTEHGRFYPDISSWKRKFVNPLLVKITNQVTAISSATKNALIQYEFIPSKKIKVVYNGIKPLQVDSDDVINIKAELGIQEDSLIFGTVARLDPIKNHQMMLHAFKLVKERYNNARLIIVGDGEELDNITATIHHLGLKDDVILTGYKTNPTSYLAIFDTYLLSSFSEGTSMTLLEAMSISKPCVVTDAGGNKEIVVNNENGFVTPNNDAEAFANAMIKLVENPEMHKKKSAKSAERYRELFSDKAMNNEYENIYKALC